MANEDGSYDWSASTNGYTPTDFSYVDDGTVSTDPTTTDLPQATNNTDNGLSLNQNTTGNSAASQSYFDSLNRAFGNTPSSDPNGTTYSGKVPDAITGALDNSASVINQDQGGWSITGMVKGLDKLFSDGKGGLSKTGDLAAASVLAAFGELLSGSKRKAAAVAQQLADAETLKAQTTANHNLNLSSYTGGNIGAVKPGLIGYPILPKAPQISGLPRTITRG